MVCAFVFKIAERKYEMEIELAIELLRGNIDYAKSKGFSGCRCLVEAVETLIDEYENLQDATKQKTEAFEYWD